MKIKILKVILPKFYFLKSQKSVKKLQSRSLDAGDGEKGFEEMIVLGDDGVGGCFDGVQEGVEEGEEGVGRDGRGEEME